MNGRILVGDHEGTYVIRFEGDVRVTICGSFDHYLDRMLNNSNFKSVLVDLSDAIGVDSTSLGVLAKLSLGVQERTGDIPTLVCMSADIERILVNMGFDDVFVIVNDYENDRNLGELPVSADINRDELRRRVIEAHEVLMAMNESNREAFRDLVNALEAEADDENKQRAS